MKSFIQEYEKTIGEAVGADFENNWDVDRFGLEEKKHGKQLQSSKSWIRRLCFFTERDLGKVTNTAFEFIKPYLSDLDWLYGKLADEESRRWVVLLTAYRALGHRRIRLPTNCAEFWKARDLALTIPQGEEEIDPEFLGWRFHERHLEKLGYPIRMFCMPGAFYPTFVLEQYRCETETERIECEKGDMVIDGGGCYGDSALYFAHKSGPEGRVASFEFLPINVSIFQRNMALNPELAKKIRLYENPLYSEGGKDLFVVSDGPGTRVVKEASDLTARKARTLRIDDLIASGDFPRIDLIKLDIEGAELEALKGSESVLRNFKPKLAITIYHKFEDFWTIPQFLDGLNLGYRFYIRHFTIHSEETVLFANTRT